MRLSLFGKFMKTGADDHFEEMTLERYSMGLLAEEVLIRLEQHLLLCEVCRLRVTAADAYIQTMKVALRELPAAIQQPRWNFRLSQAFAACALLIVVSVASFAPSDRQHAPVAIALLANRETDMQTHGPSGRVLALQPDLTGLAVAPSYRLEMISISGSTIWRGALFARIKAAVAIVPPELPGVYFVRVSLPSGKLLREYALELSN